MRTLLLLTLFCTAPALPCAPGEESCAMATLAAGDAAPPPVAASPPAQPNDAPPATDAPAVSPQLDQWLDRLEAKAKEIKTLRAGVRYDRVQGLLGDQQRRFGTLVYHAGPPARFAVHFDRLVIQDVLRRQDRSFIFDGRWFAERHGESKLFIRRELAPEGQEGKLDLLALGEGPFALPLNLEKQRLLERFNVTLIAEHAEQEDLAHTLHLRLEPREHVRIDQDWIDVWYDRETLLPVQVHAEREEAEESSIIRLMDAELNVEVDEAVFDTAPPAEAGWDVQEHRFQQQQSQQEAEQDAASQSP